MDITIFCSNWCSIAVTRPAHIAAFWETFMLGMTKYIQEKSANNINIDVAFVIVLIKKALSAPK